MLVASSFRTVAFLIAVFFAASALVACRKDEPPSGKTPAPLSADALKKEIAELEAPLAGLMTRYKQLHAEFDPLPPNLPGFGDVRAKFYGTDEALGRMGVKLTLLVERADAAAKTGNREELENVSKDVARTREQFRQLDQIGLQLVHQVLPFKKMAADMQADQAAGGGAFLRVLPSGYSLAALKGDAEHGLIEFIEDAERKIEPNTWFDLDSVSFVGDSAELDREKSKAQLQNVAEISKAYPALELKISAYTDRSGAPAAKKVAIDRAAAVEKELVTLGVPKERLATGGRPLVCASAIHDECQAQSRRATVLITAR